MVTWNVYKMVLERLLLSRVCYEFQFLLLYQLLRILHQLVLNQYFSLTLEIVYHLLLPDFFIAYIYRIMSAGDTAFNYFDTD